MTKLDTDVAEIMDYVSGWHANHPDIAVDGVRPKIKSAYKQFHSILIWRVALDQSDMAEDLRLYVNESTSDISHAFFLNLISLYKSSRSSLRSGIENFVRVILLSNGEDMKALTSVFDLFAAARKLLITEHAALKIFDDLRILYGELCKSVHSAKVDYLAQTVPFDKLSQFDQVQFFGNIEKTREVCALVNQLSFWCWNERLAFVGHENADFVSDSVPRKLKRLKSDYLGAE
ncbi:MAG: hypothetical protein EOO77_03735 [Oxalobacteraceae bacterium]|nr:MAG: hypothetical protein EOO77_03735 [Oxalobacteraceae bacterium]